MIFAALLAGNGFYEMAEKVLCNIAPRIAGTWILTPRNKGRNWDLITKLPRVYHINTWSGPDSHDLTGRNRERMRQAIRRHLEQMQGWPYPDWIWFGDDDALPADDFFQKLEAIRYDYPVLLTGRTLNSDGRRWYDICSFQRDGHPFCVPYDDWNNPRWAEGLYASGNQHILNLAGFSLNIPYPSIRGEDPHFCWAFKRAGGKIEFRPELICTLQKLHCQANHGASLCC